MNSLTSFLKGNLTFATMTLAGASAAFCGKVSGNQKLYMMGITTIANTCIYKASNCSSLIGKIGFVGVGAALIYSLLPDIFPDLPTISSKTQETEKSTLISDLQASVPENQTPISEKATSNVKYDKYLNGIKDTLKELTPKREGCGSLRVPICDKYFFDLPSIKNIQCFVGITEPNKVIAEKEYQKQIKIKYLKEEYRGGCIIGGDWIELGREAFGF